MKNQFEQFVSDKQEAPTLKKSIDFRQVLQKVSSTILHNKRKIAIGSEILGAISEFRQHKVYYGLLSKGVSIALDNFAGGEVATDLFNNQNGWIQVYNIHLLNLFLNELKMIPSKLIYFKYDSGQIETRLSELDGVPFAYCIDLKNKIILDFFIKSNDVLNFRKIINLVVSLKLKDESKKIFCIEPADREDDLNMKLYVQDYDTYESAISSGISDKIKKYLSKNISRSIILNGPPGTGKTTLSKSIAKNLELKVLKIKKSENLTPSIILELVDFLQIECVILDDFDYGKDLNTNLDLLENLKNKVKVVIGIINNLHELSPALIRPGRFDEILSIEGLPEDTVKLLLGKENIRFFDQVKDWPVSFINELIFRSKVLSEDELEESLQELSERESHNKETFKDGKAENFDL